MPAIPLLSSSCHESRSNCGCCLSSRADPATSQAGRVSRGRSLSHQLPSRFLPRRRDSACEAAFPCFASLPPASMRQLLKLHHPQAYFLALCVSATTSMPHLLKLHHPQGHLLASCVFATSVNAEIAKNAPPTMTKFPSPTEAKGTSPTGLLPCASAFLAT